MFKKLIITLLVLVCLVLPRPAMAQVNTWEAIQGLITQIQAQLNALTIKVNGINALAAPTAGFFLIGSNTVPSVATWVALTQDISCSASTIGQCTVVSAAAMVGRGANPTINSISVNKVINVQAICGGGAGCGEGQHGDYRERVCGTRFQ